VEWHPENPNPDQVTLGNLGDEYIARTHLPSFWVERVPPAPLPPDRVTPALDAEDGPRPSPDVASVLAIAPVQFDVSALVKYGVRGQGGRQAVYVRATDVSRQVVSAAIVEVAVRFRSGDRVVRAGNTNSAR
jgi:hypothetical protein